MRIAQIEGIVVTLGGVVAIGDALRLVYYRNPRSIEDITGPGRYLLILGLLVAIAGAIYTFAGDGDAASSRASSAHDGRNKLLWTFGSLVGYAALIPVLGYPVATLLFFLLALRVFGFTSWRKTVAMSVAFAGGFYLLFIWLFAMPFPHGWLLR